MSDTIKESYEAICAGEEIRQNLIDLRSAAKDEAGARTLASVVGGDFSVLTQLLQSEDPKVRKNAALLLGSMESEDLLPVLFDAYLKEETLYIRADYLKAISKLDYRPLAGALEERLRALQSVESWTPEEWKHISEELRMLQSMVLHCKGIRRHRFSGSKEKETVILLTNRRYREVTARQLPKAKITMLSGGLRAEGVSLKEVLQIRTFSELLFPLETKPLDEQDPAEMGKTLAEPALAVADRIYRGGGVFLFRLELRCGSGQKAPFTEQGKGAYVRKITDAAERASGGRLVNSVSDYEIELRLVLRRDGTFTAMLKPSSDFDTRFAYRREVVASSISPVNAALTAALALPWLKEDAQVLDPFCGVGTMLIERDRARKAGTMYGVDLFGEAVEKARRNTERASCRVNYVNRDFFTFRHAYPFDEVITDMPLTAADGSKQALRGLYHQFFDVVRDLLKEEAVLILYTSAPNYVVESSRAFEEYHTEKTFLINEKNGTTVFVISFRRKNG